MMNRLGRAKGVLGFLQIIALWMWLGVAGVAQAAPVVTIDSPQAGASVSADNVTVTGTATAVGGGQGIDLVVVMDDSGSLSWTDPTRDRFNALQGLMNSFGAGVNVKVGLVFFSNAATVAVPLTDASSATGAINSTILSRLVPNGGTAIGSGIQAAASELAARGRNGSTKIILLFTDGEETGGSNPVGAATDAASQGITVNVVDLGGNAANAQIASAGGGVTLAASNSQQLADMFRSGQMVGLSSVTVTNVTTGQPAVSVNISAGAFTAPLDLAQGSNILRVVATDTSNVSTTTEVTVTRQTSTPTVPPTRSVKLRPQVLMAGFDPMLIDIVDTSFKVVAVVRGGAAGIGTVSLSENTGSGLGTAMTELGKLSNDDRVYAVTYTFARGSIPSGTPLANLWGSRQGQYKVSVTDSAQQEHSFPALEFGNNVNLTTSAQLPAASDYTTQGIRRSKPQVVLAGLDPILVDISDTQFKVKAVARAGLAPIQGVSLQNGSGFAQAMTREGALPNGDDMYSITLTFPRGAFPAASMRDLWGTANSAQFVVEVTDTAQQTHRYPELTVGNYPVLP